MSLQTNDEYVSFMWSFDELRTDNAYYYIAEEGSSWSTASTDCTF